MPTRVVENSPSQRSETGKLPVFFDPNWAKRKLSLTQERDSKATKTHTRESLFIVKVASSHFDTVAGPQHEGWKDYSKFLVPGFLRSSSQRYPQETSSGDHVADIISHVGEEGRGGPSALHVCCLVAHQHECCLAA